MFTNQDQIDSAVQRMADKVGEEDPFPAPKLTAAGLRSSIGPHLKTAYVPALPPTVSFALRRFGAQRFANIWLDVKKVAQAGLCVSESCYTKYQSNIIYIIQCLIS